MHALIGWALLSFAVVMALRHPSAALFGLIATDYIRPQDDADPLVVRGFQSVKFSMVLNAVALLMLALRYQRYRLRWERFHGALFVLFLAIVNSWVFAFRPDLAWPRVYDYMLTFLQYVFICAFIRDKADLRKLFWAISLSISFVAARYCYGKFALNEYGWEGPTGDRNELAMMIVMALPFLFVLAITATKTVPRVVALAAIVPCALVTIFTLSRGGFLGLAAVWLYILFRLHHKKWLVALAIVGVLACMSMVPPEFYARIGGLGHASHEDASAIGRINAWHAAWAMAQDRPLNGVGVGNFLVHFARYAPHPEDVHVAHSSFFQIMGDTGFPGLFAWLFLVASLWWTAARVETRIKRMDRGAWSDERYYVLAVKAAWFGYVICGAFLSQEDFDFFYQLLGIASRLLVFASARAALGASSVAVPAPSVARASPAAAPGYAWNDGGRTA